MFARIKTNHNVHSWGLKMVKNKGKFTEKFEKILEEEGIVHMTLIDPDPFKIDLEEFDKIAKLLSDTRTDIYMVGGSTAIEQKYVDEVVKMLKSYSNNPVILFPGSISGVSRYADAIFFLSPLNSRDWYFLIGAQMLAAPTIKRWGLETVSLAYLIFEPGGTAGYVSNVNPIPRNKPEIALAYSIAADFIGFDMIYLEAGSGAPEPIPETAVKLVSKNVEKPVIVGGGIRNIEQAEKIAKAGASAIVQGSKIEEAFLKGELDNYIESLNSFIIQLKKSKKG